MVHWCRPELGWWRLHALCPRAALDHVMVPINLRLTAEDIVSALKTAGACSIRRLTRGVEFDRIESIHRRDPYADVKYGVGEHRYVFSKG